LAQYIKIGGRWKQIRSVYKKVNGTWIPQEYYNFDDNIHFFNAAEVDVDVFTIVSEDSYTGKQFYLVAKFNGTRVYPTWSITSGNEYATVNSNGKVTILAGAHNNTITVHASLNGLGKSKTITVSYSNQLSIEGADTMSGTSGNLIALYNSTIVVPTWSITSGSQYAEIYPTGQISIMDSGQITVSATYDGYTATKVITLVYDENSSAYTDVDPDTGAVTTTETTTTVDPETGATIETTTSTTTNTDGSTSETSTETTTNTDGSTTTTETTTNSDGSSSSSTTSVSSADSDGAVTTETSTTTNNADGTSTETNSTTVENEDGSSTSTSSTVNYDENGNETSSSSSTVNVSSADSDGAVTTETSTTTNNADGTSSESTSTLVENEDGSSSSQSQTVNYDENGDTTGSTTNETNVNSDGSSQSSTTNYDASGDPTDTTNVGTDTTGNVDTQNIEYDEEGNQTVTGYDINTEASEGEGKEISGDGVNTEFVPFDDQGSGFICHIRFKTVQSEQPRPPLVEDIDDSGTNYLYNVMSAKSPTKIGNYYPGFDIRWAISKTNASSGVIQFRYAPANSGNTQTNLTPYGDNEYDITVTYDPHKLYNNYKLRVTSALGSIQTIQADKEFSTLNMDFTIGCALSSQGTPYRHANVTIYEFTITKLH